MALIADLEPEVPHFVADARSFRVSQSTPNLTLCSDAIDRNLPLSQVRVLSNRR